MTCVVVELEAVPVSDIGLEDGVDAAEIVEAWGMGDKPGDKMAISGVELEFVADGALSGTREASLSSAVGVDCVVEAIVEVIGAGEVELKMDVTSELVDDCNVDSICEVIVTTGVDIMFELVFTCVVDDFAGIGITCEVQVTCDIDVAAEVVEITWIVDDAGEAGVACQE